MIVYDPSHLKQEADGDLALRVDCGTLKLMPCVHGHNRIKMMINRWDSVVKVETRAFLLATELIMIMCTYVYT